MGMLNETMLIARRAQELAAPFDEDSDQSTRPREFG
jgi:hypothetical protein